ncbi:MAG: hemolysin, partial [Acidobacteriota bacterium]|nr:hemolysin [Acidobacteriota bacterium]
ASAHDDCDPGVDRDDDVQISEGSSDEADDIPGGGDGNTHNDIVIAPDCKSVQLRAERDGNGNGRVYTITSRVRDASGNTTKVTSKIKIFANSFNVVDDGPHNTVHGCP